MPTADFEPPVDIVEGLIGHREPDEVPAWAEGGASESLSRSEVSRIAAKASDDMCNELRMHLVVHAAEAEVAEDVALAIADGIPGDLGAPLVILGKYQKLWVTEWHAARLQGHSVWSYLATVSCLPRNENMSLIQFQQPPTQRPGFNSYIGHLIRRAGVCRYSEGAW